MKLERLMLWGVVCFSLLSVGAAVWASLKFALPIILPFALAYGLAYGVRRFSKFMNGKIKLTKKVWSGIFVAVSLALIFCGVWFGAAALVRSLRELIPRAADAIGGSFAENVSRFIYSVGERFGGGEKFAEKVYDVLGNIAASLAGGAAGGGFISALPYVAFTAVLTVIAFFAFVFGDFRLTEKILGLFPESRRDDVKRYMQGAVTGSGKYIRAQGIVMLSNALILAVGFLVIKCRSAVVLALTVAALDILPVLGVGTVLVPWALYCFIIGDNFRAWALLVILVCASIAREALEARLTGRGVGVNPVYILAAVYAGYRICSVWGMILLPLFVNIVAAARNQVNKKSQ